MYDVISRHSGAKVSKHRSVRGHLSLIIAYGIRNLTALSIAEQTFSDFRYEQQCKVYFECQRS